MVEANYKKFDDLEANPSTTTFESPCLLLDSSQDYDGQLRSHNESHKGMKLFERPRKFMTFGDGVG